MSTGSRGGLGTFTHGFSPSPRLDNQARIMTGSLEVFSIFQKQERGHTNWSPTSYQLALVQRELKGPYSCSVYNNNRTSEPLFVSQSS